MPFRNSPSCPSRNPNERLQMELSGRDSQPIAVQAGVNVVIESNTPNGQDSARRLTPFIDEREGSLWYGRAGLSTDQNGYIFDDAGKLVGVLKELPAERVPVMSVLVQSGSQTPAMNADVSESTLNRWTEIARVQPQGSIASMLRKLDHCSLNFISENGETASAEWSIFSTWS